MRILHQHLLAVMSVLLLLVLVTALVSYRFERSEMVWGMEEEAFSLATALSKFIEEEVVDNPYGEGIATPFPFERLIKVFDRIRKYNPPVLMALYSPDGKRVLYSTQEYHHRIIPDETLSMVQSGKTVVVPELEDDGVVSYAGVLSSNKDLIAVAKVVATPGAHSTLLDRLKKRTACLGLVGILLGLGVAYLLSARLTKEIGSLSAPPEGGWQSTEGREKSRRWFAIREIEDLRNTLNTIESVMQETVSRAGRSLVGGEQVHTVQELCNEMGADLRLPHDRRLADIRLCLRPVGVPAKGEVFASGEIGKYIYAFFGCVTEETMEETGFSASAARTLLTDLLLRCDLSEALKQVIELFEVASMMCVSCEIDTKIMKVFSVTSGALPLRKEVYSLEEGRPLVVHDLGESEKVSTLVRAILSVYAGLNCGQLADRLSYSLSHEGAGTVLVAMRT